MKNFEFVWDKEEEKRKKRFPKDSLKLLMDDSTLLMRELDSANRVQKNSIENINNWTFKNM